MKFNLFKLLIASLLIVYTYSACSDTCKANSCTNPADPADANTCTACDDGKFLETNPGTI